MYVYTNMQPITTIIHRSEPYGHCATICPHKKGVLVAYYKGPECTDDQTVTIKYVEDNIEKAEIDLYKKTGNCVLWALDNDNAGLIYSYFNDTDGHRGPSRAVHRWMYCSNWSTSIKVTNNKIEYTSPMNLPTQPSIGMLVRINPIKVNNEWILPLYHENTSYGMIMKSAGVTDFSWRTAGTIGLMMKNGRVQKGVLIQPCLWYNGKKLCSLSRDISQNHAAWYAESDDLGETWSVPFKTSITNYNNSITAINDGTESPWLIWNHGCDRSNLVIGKWDSKEMTAVPCLKINKGRSSSYPNYCIDQKGLVHIIHTDSGKIAHHIIQPDFFNSLKPTKNVWIPSLYDKD